MRIRSLALVLTCSTVALSLAGLLHGCGGGTTAKATPHCVLNSDCHGANDAGANLVCALGFCVSPCNDSSDCPSGELCIKSDNGNACRAPEIAKGCVMNSDCTKLCTDVADDGGTADSGSSDGGATAVCPIICGRDDSCRTECKTDVDCPGGNLPDGTVGMQKCTTSGACIDPIVDMSIYDPATNDFKSSVTGGAGTTGTAGTTGAAGAGAAGATGAAGTTGAAGAAGAGAAGAGAAGTRAAGTGTDGGVDAAAGTGAAGATDAGVMNPDAAEVVDMTTVTPSASVHQGQSGVTITIKKATGGLSNASVVSLGAIDKSKAAVQSSSTDTNLVVVVTVPHGAALGKQTLVVSTKGGTITATDVIEITAITAGPAGDDANAGSAMSPFRSLKQAILVADVGDTIHLMDGTYSAATVAMGGSLETWGYTVPNNLTITGDSVAGTILDGAGAAYGIDGFAAPAMFSVSNVTLKHFTRYGIYVNQPNTALTLAHININATSSAAIYIDTAATGSTITLTGTDSVLDEELTVPAIQVNGNTTVSNEHLTINITDATIEAGYYAIYMYYPSGMIFNMTGGVLKELNTYSVLTISQANNVIGNAISFTNTAITGTLDMSDKTATLTMMGGSITEKSGAVLSLSSGTAFNLTGTTVTMTDTNNAINLAAPNSSMSLSGVTINGGGAGVNQSGAGSAVKMRNTEILSPEYYAYYMTGGTLDMGTATDAGMNGLGLPISASYYALEVQNSTGSTITSSSTTFGDHLSATNTVIKGLAPSAGVVAGPVTRAPQIYTVSAGSQITFF
jgi:hypothetical protein